MPASIRPINTKKRIVIFSVDYFPYVGGAEVAVREICQRLSSYDFVLITCRNSHALPRSDRDGPVEVVRVGVGSRHFDKYIFPLCAFLCASRINARHPFSGIWGIMANTAGLTALFFRLAHPRLFYVLSAQEGDSDREYRARTWFWFPLHRLVHTKADIVIAISGFLKRRTERIGYRGPVAVIPNGVDLSSFHPAPLLRLSPGHAIVSVSRLAAKNGLEDLIRAVPIVRTRYRDATLTIVGEGSHESALRALVRTLGLDGCVIFSGAIPHADIPRYLRVSDMFVRLSLSEGFGNAFLEAMACGIPVVATGVGAIPELVIHEKNGLLCDSGDPASAARAIIRLFSDDALRSACVAGGRVTADGYSWDTIASRVGSHFDSFS